MKFKTDEFKEGYEFALNHALVILDDMFMDQAQISVDDWFRDSPNLFQGREIFIDKMVNI